MPRNPFNLPMNPDGSLRWMKDVLIEGPARCRCCGQTLCLGVDLTAVGTKDLWAELQRRMASAVPLGDPCAGCAGKPCANAACPKLQVAQ